MRRDDRLQHEMHQQFAEAGFVQAVKLDGADRAAVLGERLDGGASLGGDEVAMVLAPKPGSPAPAARPASSRGPRPAAATVITVNNLSRGPAMKSWSWLC